MLNKIVWIVSAGALALLVAVPLRAADEKVLPKPEQLPKTPAALPEKATVKPEKPRDLLKAITGYKLGDSRAALLEVSRAVQTAPAEWAPKLAALLATDATPDCKKFVLWELGLCGSSGEVPALEKLLADPDLAFEAQAALERIRGEKTKVAPAGRLAGLIEKMSMDRDALLAGLNSSDAATQEAAMRALRVTKDPQVLRAIAQLPNLSAPLIGALGGDPAALPVVTKAAASDDPSVRSAAINAIGAIGDESSLPVLLGLLERADKDERKLIGDALARLRGDGVDAALVKAAQPETIRALVARNAKSAVPALLALAEKGNAEAIRALGKLADDGTPLLALLDKDEVQSALIAIYRRSRNIQPLIAAANGPNRAAALAVLGGVGGDEALAVLRAALKGADALAAVRALSNWETAAPLADLQAVAASATDPKLKALAERGAARLAMFDVKGKKINPSGEPTPPDE